MSDTWSHTRDPPRLREILCTCTHKDSLFPRGVPDIPTQRIAPHCHKGAHELTKGGSLPRHGSRSQGTLLACAAVHITFVNLSTVFGGARERENAVQLR
ncbi:hypothetical protein OBBRIDRAFT_109535 [Obba rivulosa]|uniref:Uncharacterized protein n=1 Tax=Obba rivulosa TaxID=1052685 RepID=A0A8E2ANU4_9APHY|nr:hypothetical protein OBBRIDRAFT_109535 [Obba rivulosa]